MIRKVLGIAIVGILGFGVLVVCNSPTSAKKAFTASSLKLQNNEIDGWPNSVEDTSFTTTEALAGKINGGAYNWANVAQFKEAFYQKILRGQDTLIYSSVAILYFAQDSMATAVFNSEFPKISDTCILAPYTLSVAAGDTSVAGGIRAIAHFKKFYFEINLIDPLFDNKALAMAEAIKFLKAYENKINSNQ